MTYSIKAYGNTAPKQNDIGDEPGYDPEMGEGEITLESEGPGPTRGSGGDREEGAPLTVKALRKQVSDLQELLQNSDLKPEDKKKLAKQIASLEEKINAAAGMSTSNKEKVLGQVEGELYKIEERIVNGASDPVNGENPDEPTKVDTKAVEKEIKKYRDEVAGMTNLTEDEKTEALGKLDKMLTEIKLGKGDPEKVDVAQLQQDLQGIKDEVEKQNQYSQGVKGLAEASNMEPEKIRAKAEAKGIDMDNLPKPPTKEIIDFMCELSPELKTKLEKVEAAVNERVKSYQNIFQAANATNQSYAAETSDTDAKDVTSWQKLYDLKYHQDDKSKAVMEAMKEFQKDLIPMLKSLYPDSDVKAVEVSGFSGWEKTHREYLVADQISFGGAPLDLFGNKDGKLAISTTPDAEPAIFIPRLHFDGEGDGEWGAPTLQTYGEGGPTLVDYDDTDDWYEMKADGTEAYHENYNGA